MRFAIDSIIFKVGVFHLVIGSWVPSIWWIRELMQFHNQSSFDITKVSFFGAVVCVALSSLAICSMYAFIKLSEAD